MNNTQLTEKFEELYALACEGEREGDKDAKHVAEMLYSYVRPRILVIKGKKNG